jgi:hypothetical protein
MIDEIDKLHRAGLHSFTDKSNIVIDVITWPGDGGGSACFTPMSTKTMDNTYKYQR